MPHYQMGTLFVHEGRVVDLPEYTGVNLGLPRYQPLPARTLGTRTALTSTTTTPRTTPVDYCASATKARAAGQPAAVVAALEKQCQVQKLTGGSRGSTAATAGDEVPTGFPEPNNDDGVSPAVIAAGVVAAGVIGFVAYKKLKK